MKYAPIDLNPNSNDVAKCEKPHLGKWITKSNKSLIDNSVVELKDVEEVWNLFPVKHVDIPFTKHSFEQN